MNKKKPRVLVVDDDPTSINVLASILQELYDISIALNGQQALRVAKKDSRLDMVLLDVQIPDMNGYEICRRLKENSETSDIPVIFITASSNDQDEQKGLELGAVDYITKPFRPAIIKVRIKNHLELKRQRDLLKYLSFHDGLTKVANRSRFDTYLREEWKRAIRNHSDLSLIMLDIDNFKQFNDFYGHVIGDDCLRQVSATIKSALERSTDLVARYGGEEFACILPSTPLAGAIQLAEKIRKEICKLVIPHEKSLVNNIVTVSLGVSSILPNVNSDIADFVKETDKKLYLAKAQGRNCVIYENQ